MNDEEFPKDVLPFEEEIKKYPLFIVTIKINMT